ncbi:hypothetical protein UCDDA912_g10306 [Diaporthe ampelina]|uniref:Uncharacterized protein n=1 Tax=Diaporthe ampelina TaxID=1214573 RepID=A0A0G2F6C3_9PEZI|nr:hypothetical protein UCDDA912_g10306 [Diaporthe ampelina]
MSSQQTPCPSARPGAAGSLRVLSCTRSKARGNPYLYNIPDPATPTVERWFSIGDITERWDLDWLAQVHLQEPGWPVPCVVRRRVERLRQSRSGGDKTEQAEGEEEDVEEEEQEGEEGEAEAEEPPDGPEGDMSAQQHQPGHVDGDCLGGDLSFGGLCLGEDSRTSTPEGFACANDAASWVASQQRDTHRFRASPTAAKMSSMATDAGRADQRELHETQVLPVGHDALALDDNDDDDDDDAARAMTNSTTNPARSGSWTTGLGGDELAELGMDVDVDVDVDKATGKAD